MFHKRIVEPRPTHKVDHPEFTEWTNRDNGDLIAVFVIDGTQPQTEEVLAASSRIMRLVATMDRDDIALLKANGGQFNASPCRMTIPKLGDWSKPARAARKAAVIAALPDMDIYDEWDHTTGGTSYALRRKVV